MNKGYTLVEVLVSIMIFSIISVAAFSIFSSAIRIQKYSLASQQLLGQTSYAVEYMSRAFRMAKRAEDSNCIDVNTNYENPQHNDTKIKFITYNGECVQFYLDNKQLKMNKDAELAIPLTSDNFEVTNLKFEIVGEESILLGDDNQPKVTLFMEIEGKGSSDFQPKMKIQTTLSQRNLDL
ncbi:MAG: prepilin-type N-terminal cleavage/methylation domain-containing protein [Patescibacteria group bacterium]|nr:prepilin-type N-terminal cleavage/methylation domain-containing protein [Patescibacteria group bacterium]